MARLRVLLVLALLAAPALADPPKIAPGPLVVKSYMAPYDPGPAGEPCVRVYAILKNPTGSAAEFTKVEARYLDPQENVLSVDKQRVEPLDPGEERPLPPFFFGNYSKVYGITVQMTIAYRVAGAAFQRQFTLSNEKPGFPDGYVPQSQ